MDLTMAWAASLWEKIHRNEKRGVKHSPPKRPCTKCPLYENRSPLVKGQRGLFLRVSQESLFPKASVSHSNGLF